jgi:hypothetical protein
MKPWRPLLLAGALAASAAAQAHKASDAYVALQVDGSDVAARIDVALRDLDRDLDLDANADDALSWREVRTRWADIAGLARDGLRLEADGRRCTPQPADTTAGEAEAPALATHSDGRYAVVRLHWRCPAPVQRLAVAYALFAHTDPTHRGIIRIARADGDAPQAASGAQPSSQLAVLAPDGAWHRFELPAPAPAPARALSTATPAAAIATIPPSAPSPMIGLQRAPSAHAMVATQSADSGGRASAFAGFVREGIHHILVGYDHILFLLSLLLPAVWVRRPAAPGAAGAGWRPAEAWRPAFANVLKVVTAFTVAHSITLALSVFDVVDPPSRWIESVIAASVVLAALNNLWPVVSDSRWKLTFAFGLVHGFGFASALKDAGLAQGALVVPLVGFNAGVEIGQLCIVALVLPLAWLLRGTRTYRGAFAGGSLAIAAVAGLWLVQRAFDLSLIAG